MKIIDVICHTLFDPNTNPDATSSAYDDLVVEIITDAGIVGIGDSDTNPWMARACIESPSTHTMGMGLRDMLIDADPLDIEALWWRMYVGSAHHGRRGAGVSAIGAVDIALWDIKGKAAGKPCWQLQGEQAQDAVTPYASLQPEAGGDVDRYTKSLAEWAVRAKGNGFTAAKLEITPFGPYAHDGMNEPPGSVVEVAAACRDAVGSDMTLLVDVQYAFDDAKTALPILKELEALDVFFIETPLWVDDLEGYAYLADHLDMFVAQGEWLTTRWEFIDVMDRGKIDVAQPDVGRVGGLSEAKIVCDLARKRGRLIVPHCWLTGIGIAATTHMAVTAEHCKFIEFLPADQTDSTLRRELLDEELCLVDGKIMPPQKPGLGIEINREALKKFAHK
jgi:L-alanine-DL-glutamate epimerase-like enolase superfamily enzyme